MMLANEEWAEQIVEVVGGMNVVICAKHVEECQLSKATWPEEYVSEISLGSFELLDIKCLVCKYHSCFSAEFIEIWNPIWKLQLLRRLSIRSGKEATEHPQVT